MLRILAWVLALILIAALGVAAFVFRNIAITGQFSTLKPQALECRQVSGLTGVEDIAIDHASGLVFFSADDRRASLTGGQPASHGIYLGLYDRPEVTPQNLTPDLGPAFHPHGISLYAADGGAKALAVVNHQAPGQSQIMLFDVVEDRPNGGPPVISLKLRQTVQDALMPSANDVHLVSPTQFYASVDRGSLTSLGQMLETWFRLPRASVVYWDGTKMSRVSENLIYANGVNGAKDGSMIYVAETTGMTLRFYARDKSTGALTEKDHLYLGTSLDNIDVDETGALWIAAHPHILDFVRHAGDARIHSPSQILRVSPPTEKTGEARQVYLNDGAEISGASVAAVHRGRMLVGSVFEPKYLSCAAPN